MPGEGKIVRRFHILDEGRPSGVATSIKCKAASRCAADNKWSVNFDPEPFAEFLMIRERAPYPINASAKVHGLLNAISR
jgi:hypothetical protein